MMTEEVPRVRLKGKHKRDRNVVSIFHWPFQIPFLPSSVLREADLRELFPLVPLSSGSGSDLANRKLWQRSETGKTMMLGYLLP